jgi:hypothetical protein
LRSGHAAQKDVAMTHHVLSNVPLLGALCVAAGFVTNEQVERCLQLQRDVYPGTPIGQILVLEGYLSQPDLARMVARQQAFRRAFCLAIEQANEYGVDVSPVAVAPAPAPCAALPELGAFTATELDISRVFAGSR